MPREDRFPTMLWVVANHEISITEKAVEDRIERLNFTETLAIREVTLIRKEIEDLKSV